MASTISRKQKKRQQVLDQRDSKRFITILIIATLALLVLMYFIFQSSF